MTKNIRTQTGKIIGRTLNAYHSKLKPKVDDLKFKEQYQGRIIDCMVGEIDDNYIETPETDAAIVKLEHSKEGVIKVPTIKGKTILVDAEGNETDTPAEGCRLVSVGESEDNKLIILSKNKNLIAYPFEETSVTKYGITFTDNKDGTITLNGTSTHPNVFNYLLRISNKWNLPNGTYSYSTCSSNTDVYFVIGGGSSDVTYTSGTKGNFVVDGNLGNCGHCLMQIKNKATFNNVTIKPIIVSGSEIPLNHIPYKQHKTEILLDEPLRSLPNGVCDEIIGNKLIRRVGFTNLNGVKQWWHHWNDIELQNGSNDDYYVGSNGALIKCTNKKILKSNRLQKIGLYEPNLGYINAGGANEFGIRIPMNLLTERTEEEFKNWINSNNIQVMYELAEPVIIEMPNTLTLQGFDDTTMYIENEITPTVQYGYNAVIPYKQALKEQKEEVETNTLDIENNIIPYLMDIEMNLMLMED